MPKLNSRKQQVPHERIDIRRCSTKRGGKVPANIKWILSSCWRAGMMDYAPRRPLIPEDIHLSTYSLTGLWGVRKVTCPKQGDQRRKLRVMALWGTQIQRPNSQERWKVLWDTWKCCADRNTSEALRAFSCQTPASSKITKGCLPGHSRPLPSREPQRCCRQVG